MSLPAAWYLRSLPALNARSPAPVTTATQRSGSAAKSSKTRSSSKLAGGWMAFITSGRLMVTTRSRPLRSALQYWYSVMHLSMSIRGPAGHPAGARPIRGAASRSRRGIRAPRTPPPFAPGARRRGGRDARAPPPAPPPAGDPDDAAASRAKQLERAAVHPQDLAGEEGGVGADEEVEPVRGLTGGAMRPRRVRSSMRSCEPSGRPMVIVSSPTRMSSFPSCVMRVTMGP